MTLTPADRLGLPVGRLDIGSPADIILFDPNTSYRLDRSKLASKSKNTPFDGQILQGKVVATYVEGANITQ
jgi:dihydroorotase